MAKQVENNQKEIIESEWRSILRLGGIAALVAAILFRRWMSAELSLFSNFHLISKVPDTIEEWFALLQSNPVIALVHLNALDLVNYALVGLLFLAVFAALRKTSRGTMTLALILTFSGIAIYFATNNAFSLLSLSGQYADAATEAQRAVLLSAGQTLLTMNDPLCFGTGIFWAYIFVTTAGLLMAVIMLKSSVFSRATAIFGIIANVIGLGYFFTAAFNPALSFIPFSGSAPFLLVWYILIGIRLLKISR